VPEDPDVAPFHWRGGPEPSSPWRRLRKALKVSVLALLSALIVAAIAAAQPVQFTVWITLLILGPIVLVVVLARGSELIYLLRSVDSVSIVSGPPAVLVLRHWSGREIRHRLSEVSRLRLAKIGLRSADNPNGGHLILEIGIGTRTYRTRPAPLNRPDGDVQMLEDALRRVCPHATIEEYVNRTTWVSDTGG
jgi:hypothetical protein